MLAKKKKVQKLTFLQIHPTFRAKNYLNDEKMLNKIVFCFSPPVDHPETIFQGSICLRVLVPTHGLEGFLRLFISLVGGVDTP